MRPSGSVISSRRQSARWTNSVIAPPDTLAVILRAHGIADHTIANEVAETAEQHLAKTNNRSVVGGGVEVEFGPDQPEQL
ncbi:MAG TPA: hypothetical protein VK875_07660 [Euzebyales bacterium]|nr:hypothetical protein [Euzebyales bacterium]